MNFITLDLATRIGWTRGTMPDREFIYGTHLLPSTGEDIGAFVNAYHSWLSDLLDGDGGAYYIVFEQPVLPRETSIATLRKLYGLCAHTEFVCFRRQIKCREASIPSVRKFLTNNGHAKKDQVIRAVRNYGYLTDDNDEADAIALRLFTIGQERKDLLVTFRMDLGELGAARHAARS